MSPTSNSPAQQSPTTPPTSTSPTRPSTPLPSAATRHQPATQHTDHHHHYRPPQNPYLNHHHHTRQQLSDWLTRARHAKPPLLSSNQQRSTPAPCPNPLQQQILSPTVINDAWGDEVVTPIPSHIFRVISKNVNTLSAADDFADWRGAAQACADYQVTVACFQETNLQWSPPLFRRVHQIFHNLPEHQAKIATSNSTEVTPSNYQPGGTCTAVIGCWTSHARTTTQDRTGMG